MKCMESLCLVGKPKTKQHALLSKSGRSSSNNQKTFLAVRVLVVVCLLLQSFHREDFASFVKQVQWDWGASRTATSSTSNSTSSTSNRKISTGNWTDHHPRESHHPTQDEQYPEQCPISENHTAMEVNWLHYAKKSGLLPQNTSTVPPEGAFYKGWYPSLDCPSALETLQWKSENNSSDGITCPPGAPMWTFLEGSAVPAVSQKSSKRILCPPSGRYSLPRGQGVLCRNSMRLRPSRNEAAIARAQALLQRRQRQQPVPQSQQQQQTSNSTSQDASAIRPPHILVYMQDAVSRPALHRNMKATLRTLQDLADRGEELGTHVYEFQRHHSMGGSSINNLTPMLTGLKYEHMTQHNKAYEAWALEELRRLGYVSINTHNTCNLFNSTYGDAFNRHGPEHYFPYEMQDIGWFHSVFCNSHPKRFPRIPLEEVQANCARTLRDTKPEDCKPSRENNMGRISCLGGRSRSTLLIEHYLKVRQDLKDDDVPTFAFVHDYDLHVENVVDLHRYDEDKAAVFKMIETAGVLRDTVVLYVSDHGNQQKITLTEQGAIEYKLPFWFMMVPDRVLRQRGQEVQAALHHNQRVLTSQPDVHETMLDLAGGRGMGDADWWQEHGHDRNLLGSSVLRALPYNRTCGDAGIPAIECVCSEVIFEELDPKSNQFLVAQQQVLPQIVKHMNTELEKFDLISLGVCREVKAKELVSASSRPTATHLTAYNLRFLVHSPRSEPMEFLASATRGVLHKRGMYVGTVIQASRFAHWIQQCEQKVTDAGGNHHFCDCVEPPAVYGWDLNRTATAAT